MYEIGAIGGNMSQIKDNNNVGDMWKHFFKFERKHYNPYMMKLKEHPNHIIYDKEIMDSHKGKWNEFFKIISVAQIEHQKT